MFLPQRLPILSRSRSLALFGLLTLGSCASRLETAKQTESPSSEEGQVVVLYMSDLHGRLLSDPIHGGGYARLAALVEAEKARASKKTDVLVLFGGDAFGKSGLPCRASEEKECAPLLKDIGFQVGVLGNGELKRNLSDLNDRLRESQIPWITSNVIPAGGKPVAWNNHWVWKGPRSGAEWVFLGWSVAPSPGEFEPAKQGFDVKAQPDNRDWLQFEKLAAGRPVVWLTHQLYEDDQAWLKAACARPKLKNLMLLKGHNHVLGREDRSACAPLFEPGAFGRQMSRLLFAQKAGEWTLVSHEFVPVTNAMAQNQALQNRIEALYQRLAPKASEIVGQVSQTKEQPELAQWLADTFRKVTHAEVSFVSAGGIKEPLEAGPLSREKLLMAIPYNNPLMGADVPYEQLSKALCKSAGRPRLPNDDRGSDLTLSGGRLVNVGTPSCHLEAPSRSRVKIVVDSYLVKRSKEWMGIDLSGRTFPFGVDTQRAMDLGLKSNKGQL